MFEVQLFVFGLLSLAKIRKNYYPRKLVYTPNVTFKVKTCVVFKARKSLRVIRRRHGKSCVLFEDDREKVVSCLKMIGKKLFESKN